MTPFLLCLFAQPSVTLVEKAIPLPDALTAISKQSGVRVLSDLPRPPALNLDLRSVTPWLALDAIAMQANARLDVGRSSVKLTPLGPGECHAPTHYDGPFRIRVVRVQSTRDLTSQAGTTSVSLEVSWLPTLRPIYLDTLPHDLTVIDGRGMKAALPGESATLVPVDARPLSTIDLTLPGFPRSAANIGKLSGKLNAVVLGDLLTFDFDSNLDALRLAPPGGVQLRLTRAGVTCSVVGITLGRDRWTVKIALDYPAGANRDFESFQAGSMVVANELRLVSLDGKRTLVPSASVAEDVGPRRTVVSFHFTDGATGKRGSAAAWKVRYAAPARVLDTSLSFSFDKLPLP